MAQLDGGSGGGGDGGDSANVADDTSLDGGQEAVSPPDDIELDTQTARRLRRDATSDPMAEQTEPEPAPAPAPSPTGTSATVDGGDAATTEAPSPAETSATVDGTDAGTATAAPSPSREADAIDVSQLDAPDATDTAEPEPSGPSPADADRFGQELGGDPAGDADRTAAPGPTPDDIDQPADAPGSPVGDGPQPVTGTGPAQDGFTPPSEPPEDGAPPLQDQPPVTQGIEESGATAEAEQQAREFEQQVLAENPWLDEEDVAIQLVGTEEGVRFQVELTEGAEARVSQRQQDVIEGLGIGAGSLAATGGTDPAAEAQAEAREETQDILEGIGFFEEQAEQEQELREAVEEDIEGAVGTGRAERAGIVNPTFRENVVENVDLEAGEDFTLDIRETPGGRITVDAELTEEFSREEATRALERQLRNQFDVDLEAGEDFRVVEGEEGGFEAEFTEQGRGRVGLSTLDRTVRGVERGDIPVFTDLTGIRGPQFDIPGEGAAVPEARDTGILTPTEPGRERLLDRVDIPTALEVLGVRAEGEGPYTLADLGTDFAGAVRSGLDDIETGIQSREAQLREADVAITGGYGTGQPNPLLEATVAGIGDFAGVLGQGVGLPTRGSEFLGAAAQARQRGEFDEFTETASVTAQRLPAEFTSSQIARFRDEPVAATGGLVGTLVGTALTMRAFPRTRFLIQPAEEAIGISGFGLTRRVAGERTAQRLFPNREPLFLSEEVVIRSARRVGGGTRRAAGRVESGVGRVTGPTRGNLAERVRQAPTLRLETDPDAGFVSVDPVVRANLRETARRPGQAIRSGLESVRETPTRVRAGTVEAGRDVLESGRQAIDRGRQTLTRLDLGAEDIGFRAGQRTAAGVERARQLPSELADAPGDIASGLRQRGATAIESGRQRLTLADLQAQELGFRAGARTAEGVNRLLDIDPSDLGRGRLTGAIESGRQRLTMAELQAEDIGFRAGQRTAAGVERIGQFPSAIAELPGRGRTGAADLVAGGRQRLTLAELQAQELGFRAGQRTAAGVERVEGIFGDITAAPGRVRAAPREAAAGFQIGRGAAGLSDTPGFEAFPGQIQTGRAFEAGFETGETVSELGDRGRGLLARPRDRILGAGQALGDLPDLTLRIEPGVPRRPVVPDTAFEVEAGEADLPDTFDTAFETGETEVEDVDDAPLDPMETGRGEGPLVLAVETELESPAEFGSELAAETERPRLESAVGGDLIEQVAPSVDVGVESTLTAGEVLVGDVRGGQMERVRLGLEEELGLGLEQEGELDLETDLAFEPLFDLELEQEAEARAEAEAELATRADLETELEVQRFDDEQPRRPRDDPFDEFDETRLLLERDLLNPLTGR